MIERLDNIFQSNWVMQENSKMVLRGRGREEVIKLNQGKKTKQQTDIKKIIKDK